MPAPNTRYVHLVSRKNVATLDETVPGYPVIFDKKIQTTGYSEIRVWVHVFVNDYATHPVTSNTKLLVRFMHEFDGNSFDYAEGTLNFKVTSYINGYVARPIIGNKLRVLCHPENLPPGPYGIDVTYYLVR